MRRFIPLLVLALVGCGTSPPTPEEMAFFKVYRTAIKNMAAEVEWYEQGPMTEKFTDVRKWAIQWDAGPSFDKGGDMRLLPSKPSTARFEKFRNDLSDMAARVDELRTIAAKQSEALNEGSPLVARKIRNDGIEYCKTLRKEIASKIEAIPAEAR